MILYISLHLFPRGHKVIISSVHFIFSSTPCCICRQNAQRSTYKSVGIILCNAHTSHIHHLYNIGQLTWYTTAKFIRKLGDEIVIDTILERSEHDHGTRVLYHQLLHSFVWKHVLFAACNVLIKDHIYTILWHVPPLPLSSGEDGRLLANLTFLQTFKQHTSLSIQQ